MFNSEKQFKQVIDSITPLIKEIAQKEMKVKLEEINEESRKKITDFMENLDPKVDKIIETKIINQLETIISLKFNARLDEAIKIAEDKLEEKLKLLQSKKNE